MFTMLNDKTQCVLQVTPCLMINLDWLGHSKIPNAGPKFFHNKYHRNDMVYRVYRSFCKTNLEALMSHQVSRFMTKDWCTKLFIIHPIYMNKTIPILYYFKTGSCGMVSWLESIFGTDLSFFCFRTCSQLPTCLIQTPFSIDKTSWSSPSTNLKHLNYMKLWFPVMFASD